jgi:signal transduction histidine kinase
MPSPPPHPLPPLQRRVAGRVVVWGLGILILCAILPPSTDAAEAPLTTAVAVRSLREEEAAKKLPVELRGTVVFIEGPNGAIVLQDSTAGTYFRGQNETSLQPGDELQVKGVTTPGTYLPGIEQASYVKLGHRELPPAQPATYADILSGRYFFQRIAVEGIVHAVVPTSDESRSILTLALGQDLLEVRICAPPQEGRQLTDSRVRIEGLAAGGVNQRRQLVQAIAWVHDWSGLQVIKPAPPESEVPLISGSRLLAFDALGQDRHRVRMAGTVIAAFPDGEIFVRDDATALRMQMLKHLPLPLGTRVEALGFPKMQRFSASLVNAQVLRQEPGPVPAAIAVSLADLIKGKHDNDLVTVTADLTSSFQTEDGHVLVLQEAGRSLRVQMPADGRQLPAGARVQVTGICLVDSNTASGTTSTPRSVHLRARLASDVAVLSAPPWWTSQRLALAVGLLLLAMALSALWITFLRRQVRRQTQALRRQIQHEATLEERQRIAREFHDTLEQGLTGLALRLDAVKARGADEKSVRLLQASRRLVSQIHEETRSLVSELRQPSHEALDLKTELARIAEEHTTDCGPAVEFQADTPLPALPSHIVHHLKMIAREAVTNALKHAQALHVVMRVHMRSQCLRIAVADDGQGFDFEARHHGLAARFGCIGIEERCEKLGATAHWRTSPGQGTLLEITLPVNNAA